MNTKTCLILTLCAPLLACDLLDTEGMTSAADTGDASSADESEGEGEGTEGDEPTGDEPSDEESSGGGGVDSSGSGDSDDDPSDVPPNLIGSWYAGDGETSLATLDVYTNGTYAEDRKGQVPAEGCLADVDLQVSGDYTVAGDVLTLHATTSHLFIDECGVVEESEELPPDGVYTFQLGADEWGYTLRITPEGGEWADSILYHRL